MEKWRSEMSHPAPRYAIYYAPRPDEQLWQFGSQIVGYDAVTGENIPPPDFLGDYIDRWPSLTSEPRKYGFHATLKAPFHLADGSDETMLVTALRHYAEATTKVPCNGLKLATIGPFIALVPQSDNIAINDLAFSIVEQFDRFRAPLTDFDRARRLASPLTEKQIQYLERYGYPYVKDEFRFHLTLTNSLHQDERQAIFTLLENASVNPVKAFAGLIDRVCLFKQDHPSSRFRILATAELR